METRAKHKAGQQLHASRGARRRFFFFFPPTPEKHGNGRRRLKPPILPSFPKRNYFVATGKPIPLTDLPRRTAATERVPLIAGEGGGGRKKSHKTDEQTKRKKQKTTTTREPRLLLFVYFPLPPHGQAESPPRHRPRPLAVTAQTVGEAAAAQRPLPSPTPGAAFATRWALSRHNPRPRPIPDLSPQPFTLPALTSLRRSGWGGRAPSPGASYQPRPDTDMAAAGEETTGNKGPAAG